MDAAELKSRLLSAKDSSDFVDESYGLVDDLRSSGADLESVRTVLRFMEDYPAVDYGAPGPLVSFVEKFYGSGYEEELLQSLLRRPTPHTVGMLNRLINGAKTAETREKLIEVMCTIKDHPSADEETRHRALEYLQGLPGHS